MRKARVFAMGGLIAPLVISSFSACSSSSSSSSSDAGSDAASASDAIALHLDCGALQTALDDAVAQLGEIGAVAEVRHAGARCGVASGLSDVSAKTPMPTDGNFQIGSITKTFTATVVLELASEGKISLDAPLSQWVPTFPNAQNITVRQLLSHTSGIYNYTDDPSFQQALISNPKRVWQPSDLVAYAAAQPPYFAPGAGFHYSNTNFILAAMIVEAATSDTFVHQLRQRILGTLPHTFLSGAEPVPETLVHHYSYSPLLDGGSDGGSSIVDVTTMFDYSYAWSAGALVSNADDVSDFIDALIGGKLLDASMLSQMEPAAGAPTLAGYGPYGLGIIQLTTSVGTGYGHGGHAGGSLGFALRVPSADLTIVLLLNDDKSEDDVLPIIGKLGNALGAP